MSSALAAEVAAKALKKLGPQPETPKAVVTPAPSTSDGAHAPVAAPPKRNEIKGMQMALAQAVTQKATKMHHMEVDEHGNLIRGSSPGRSSKSPEPRSVAQSEKPQASLTMAVDKQPTNTEGSAAPPAQETSTNSHEQSAVMENSTTVPPPNTPEETGQRPLFQNTPLITGGQNDVKASSLVSIGDTRPAEVATQSAQAGVQPPVTKAIESIVGLAENKTVGLVNQSAAALGQTIVDSQSTETTGQTTGVNQSAPATDLTTVINQSAEAFGQTAATNQSVDVMGQKAVTNQPAAVVEQTTVINQSTAAIVPTTITNQPLAAVEQTTVTNQSPADIVPMTVTNQSVTNQSDGGQTKVGNQSAAANIGQTAVTNQAAAFDQTTVTHQPGAAVDQTPVVNQLTAAVDHTAVANQPTAAAVDQTTVINQSAAAVAQMGITNQPAAAIEQTTAANQSPVAADPTAVINQPTAIIEETKANNQLPVATDPLSATNQPSEAVEQTTATNQSPVAADPTAVTDKPAAAVQPEVVAENAPIDSSNQPQKITESLVDTAPAPESTKQVLATNQQILVGDQTVLPNNESNVTSAKKVVSFQSSSAISEQLTNVNEPMIVADALNQSISDPSAPATASAPIAVIQKKKPPPPSSEEEEEEEEEEEVKPSARSPKGAVMITTPQTKPPIAQQVSEPAPISVQQINQATVTSGQSVGGEQPISDEAAVNQMENKTLHEVFQATTAVASGGHMEPEVQEAHDPADSHTLQQLMRRTSEIVTAGSVPQAANMLGEVQIARHDTPLMTGTQQEQTHTASAQQPPATQATEVQKQQTHNVTSDEVIQMKYELDTMPVHQPPTDNQQFPVLKSVDPHFQPMTVSLQQQGQVNQQTQENRGETSYSEMRRETTNTQVNPQYQHTRVPTQTMVQQSAAQFRPVSPNEDSFQMQKPKMELRTDYAQQAPVVKQTIVPVPSHSMKPTWEEYTPEEPLPLQQVPKVPVTDWVPENQTLGIGAGAVNVKPSYQPATLQTQWPPLTDPSEENIVGISPSQIRFGDTQDWIQQESVTEKLKKSCAPWARSMPRHPAKQWPPPTSPLTAPHHTQPHESHMQENQSYQAPPVSPKSAFTGHEQHQDVNRQQLASPTKYHDFSNEHQPHKQHVPPPVAHKHHDILHGVRHPTKHTSAGATHQHQSHHQKHAQHNDLFVDTSQANSHYQTHSVQRQQQWQTEAAATNEHQRPVTPTPLSPQQRAFSEFHKLASAPPPTAPRMQQQWRPQAPPQMGVQTSAQGVGGAQAQLIHEPVPKTHGPIFSAPRLSQQQEQQHTTTQQLQYQSPAITPSQQPLYRPGQQPTAFGGGGAATGGRSGDVPMWRLRSERGQPETNSAPTVTSAAPQQPLNQMPNARSMTDGRQQQAQLVSGVAHQQPYRQVSPVRSPPHYQAQVMSGAEPQQSFTQMSPVRAPPDGRHYQAQFGTSIAPQRSPIQVSPAVMPHDGQKYQAQQSFTQVSSVRTVAPQQSPTQVSIVATQHGPPQQQAQHSFSQMSPVRTAPDIQQYQNQFVSSVVPQKSPTQVSPAVMPHDARQQQALFYQTISGSETGPPAEQNVQQRFSSSQQQQTTRFYQSPQAVGQIGYSNQPMEMVQQPERQFFDLGQQRIQAQSMAPTGWQTQQQPERQAMATEQQIQYTQQYQTSNDTRPQYTDAAPQQPNAVQRPYRSMASKWPPAAS